MTPTPLSVPPRRERSIAYTPHASMNMALRGVGRDDVERAIRDPEVRYAAGSKYPQGYQMHQRGDLTVVVNPTYTTFMVVTVLWRTEDQWTDEQMRGRVKA